MDERQSQDEVSSKSFLSKWRGISWINLQNPWCNKLKKSFGKRSGKSTLVDSGSEKSVYFDNPAYGDMIYEGDTLSIISIAAKENEANCKYFIPPTNDNNCKENDDSFNRGEELANGDKVLTAASSSIDDHIYDTIEDAEDTYDEYDNENEDSEGDDSFDENDSDYNSDDTNSRNQTNFDEDNGSGECEEPVESGNKVDVNITDSEKNDEGNEDVETTAQQAPGEMEMAMNPIKTLKQFFEEKH